MTTTKITNSQIPAAVANFETFKANSANAEFKSFGCSGGELPKEYRHQLAKAFEDHASVYIVYSYSTPIAWHAGGVWTLPAVRYSVTTSKHQSLVRRGIAF